MPLNKPPADELLDEVAELRASGLTWEAVAARMKRSMDTLRAWPRKYADRWAAAFSRAERRLARDHCAESAVTLRGLLRSRNEQNQRIAARDLIYFRLQLDMLDIKSLPPPIVISQAQFDEQAARSLLEGLTDEQQEAYLARLRPPAILPLPDGNGGGAPPRAP